MIILYLHCFFYFFSSALEELSVRSNIALSQKNFVRELDCDSEELEAEYVALCAQVVSAKYGLSALHVFRAQAHWLEAIWTCRII